MSQTQFTTVVAANTSGSAFVTLHNMKFAAIRSMEEGSTPPPSPPRGCLWYDTSSQTTPIIRVWDGSQWIALIGIKTSEHLPFFVMDGDRDTNIFSDSDGTIKGRVEGSIRLFLNSTGLAIGSSAATCSLDLGANTDGLIVPKGTTAQDGTASAGKVRWNATLGRLTVGDGSAHRSLAFSDDTLTPADDSVGTDQLKISGYGQINQYPASDGDGSMTWRDLPDSVDQVTERLTAVTRSNTGGRYIEWTGLPADVRRIDICLYGGGGGGGVGGGGGGGGGGGVGGGVQIGDSGGFETSQYSGYCDNGDIEEYTWTTGYGDSQVTHRGYRRALPLYDASMFPINGMNLDYCIGTVSLVNPEGNRWVASGVVHYYESRDSSIERYSDGQDGGRVLALGGQKKLSGTLDRVRLVIDSGRNFSGKANVLYWRG